MNASARTALLAAVFWGCLATLAISQPLPTNYVVTPNFPGLQNEEQIFICRDDPTRVLINHRDFRLGYRQIGLGHGVEVVPGVIWTFTDTLVAPSYQIFERQSDPVMTINSAGDYIICHLDYQDVPIYDSSHIAFLVSQDCGATWNGPYTVLDTIGPYFEDKQFITSDRTGGTYDGNVYLSWTRFPESPSTTYIMFSRSTTGAATWDEPIAVGPPFFVSCAGGDVYAGQFSQPLVGKDGAVYVFWQGWDIDSLGGNCDFYTGIQFNKSTDGGVTWQGARTIGRVDGWSAVDGGVDVYSQPTTIADISNGPHAGNLYLQYRDTSGAPFWDSDIMFRRSLDTGNTWSAPYRVNDDPLDPDVDQFHNWLVANEEGILVSIWYDQRRDPSHFQFDVYAAYSYDGGATWTSNHLITEQMIDPASLAAMAAERDATEPASPVVARAPQAPQAGLIAEYIGVDCTGDKVAATWTGTALGYSGNSAQDVFFASWELPLMTPRLIRPVAGQLIFVGDPDLRWATSWKENDDSYQLQISATIDFSSIERDITVDSAAWHGALDDLPYGLYYWRVRASGGAVGSGGFSAPDSFTVPIIECICPLQGDYDESGFIDATDLAILIDVVFFGVSDIQDGNCITTRGDFNCDGFTDAVDLALLIDHVFFGGSGPCDPCL